MAAEQWRTLEFADGEQAVDEPFASWILEATSGVTKNITFQAAMNLVNDRPLKHALQGVERAVYRAHFRNLGG